MIVALAEEVCEYVHEVDRLQLQQNSANRIKQTSAALQLLEREVTQLIALTIVLRFRLRIEDLRKIYYHIERLSREIKQSQEAFCSGTYHQAKLLDNLCSDAKKRTQEAQDLWKQYASKQTKEIFELFNLVSHLPEISGQKTAYEDRLAEIQRATEQAPQTFDQLRDFELKLGQFSEQLNKIQGLNDQVKVFLQRTLKGEATLADLTDDVLEWCRQGQHAKTFTVRFAQ